MGRKCKGKTGRSKKGNNKSRGAKRKGRKGPRTFSKKQRSGSGAQKCPSMRELSNSTKLWLFGWTKIKETKALGKGRMANHLNVEECRHLLFECLVNTDLMFSGKESIKERRISCAVQVKNSQKDLLWFFLLVTFLRAVCLACFSCTLKKNSRNGQRDLLWFVLFGKLFSEQSVLHVFHAL